MNRLNKLSKYASVIPYAFIAMPENIEAVVIADNNAYSERLDCIADFTKGKSKFEFSKEKERVFFNAYNTLITLIQESDLKYKFGVEFSNDNSIFITSIFTEKNIELHSELSYQDDKLVAFFTIYEGDNMVDTGIYELDKTCEILKKYLENQVESSIELSISNGIS